jgi:hypothetical protein
MCFRITVFWNIKVERHQCSAALLYVGEAKEPVIISIRDICVDGCDSEMVVWTPIEVFTHNELFFKDYRVRLKRMFL